VGDRGALSGSLVYAVSVSGTLRCRVSFQGWSNRVGNDLVAGGAHITSRGWVLKGDILCQ
jgi:hypothetical protein